MHDSGGGDDADDGDDGQGAADVSPFPSLSSPAIGKRSCEEKGPRMSGFHARRPTSDESARVEDRVVGSGGVGAGAGTEESDSDSTEESDNDHRCPCYYPLACDHHETGMVRETLEGKSWEDDPGTLLGRPSGKQEEVVVAAVGRAGEQNNVDEDDRTAECMKEEKGENNDAQRVGNNEYMSERVEGKEGKGSERWRSESMKVGRRGSETEPGGGAGGGRGGEMGECILEDEGSVSENKNEKGVNVQGQDSRRSSYDEKMESWGVLLETQIGPNKEEEACLNVKRAEEKCNKFRDDDICVGRTRHGQALEGLGEDIQSESGKKNRGTELAGNRVGRGVEEIDTEHNWEQVDEYDWTANESETLKAHEKVDEMTVQTGRGMPPLLSFTAQDIEDLLDNNDIVVVGNIASVVEEWKDRRETGDKGGIDGDDVGKVERKEELKVAHEMIADEGGDNEGFVDSLGGKRELIKERNTIIETEGKVLNWERGQNGTGSTGNVEEDKAKLLDLVITSFIEGQIENRDTENEDYSVTGNSGIPVFNSENIAFNVNKKKSCETFMLEEHGEKESVGEMVKIENEKEFDNVYSEKLKLQKNDEVLSFYYYPRDRLPSFHSAVKRTFSEEVPATWLKSGKENSISSHFCSNENENKRSEEECDATGVKEEESREGVKDMEQAIEIPIEKDIKFDERWLDTLKSLGGEPAPIGFDYEGEMEKVLFECKHLEVIFDTDTSCRNSGGDNEDENNYETCGTCGRGFKRTKDFDDLGSYAVLQSSFSSLKDKKRLGGLSHLFLGCFTTQSMRTGEVKESLAAEETTESNPFHNEGWKEAIKERNMISRIKDKSSPVKTLKDFPYSGKKKISLPVDGGREFVDNKRKSTYLRRRFRSLSQIFTIASKAESFKNDGEDLCDQDIETQVNSNSPCSEGSCSIESSLPKVRGRRKRHQRPNSCIEVGHTSLQPEGQHLKKISTEEESKSFVETKAVGLEGERGVLNTINCKPVSISKKPNRRRTRRPKSCGDIDYYSATCTFILEGGFDQIDSDVAADRVADRMLVTPAKYNKRRYDTQGEQQVQYSPHGGNKARPPRHRAFSLGMEDVSFRLSRSPNMLWDWLNGSNSVRMEQKHVGNDARSIYRRGARRWRKLYKVNGHTFQAKRFNRRAFCAICKDRIWGLGRQGFKCIQCKLLVHKKCHKLQSIPCNQFDTSTDTLGSNDSTLSRPGANGKVAMPDYNCNAAAAVAAAAVASVVPDPGMSEETQVELPANKEAVTGTTSGGAGQYCLDDFELIRVIGRGSYAKVLMVELKRTKRIYAMKVIKKTLVTDDEDIDWVQTEKHVFETASNHPFLVGLHSCFQTPSRLFFVIEFVRGGDLMFHMQRQRRLPEEHARFYAAEICLALNFLHEKGIIYRDLKLDNVLLDHEGHIKLTDYGMCKEGIRPGDTTSTFCGTPNYIAPEILQGVEYSFSVDWWALGVLMFEMLAGKSPFDIVGANDNPDCNTEDFLFQVILERPIRIPRSLSLKAASILKGFLNKNPMDRLGCHPETGFQDIVTHQFFKNIEWELLERKQIAPPYKPRVDGERDLENFDPQFTAEPVQFTPDDPREIDVIDQSEFEGFEYVNPLLMSMEDCV